jgi:hypothetical protein
MFRFSAQKEDASTSQIFQVKACFFAFFEKKGRLVT